MYINKKLYRYKYAAGIVLTVLLLIVLFTFNLTNAEKRNNAPPSKESYISRSFSITPNKDWGLVSFFDHPGNGREEIRFSRRLENIDMYVRVSRQKETDELYRHAFKLPIFFRGMVATKYIVEDCGGGKSMGSFCEYIVFNRNDRWFSLSLFDSGSRTGKQKSESLFKEFISTLTINDYNYEEYKSYPYSLLTPDISNDEFSSEYFTLSLPQDWELGAFSASLSYKDSGLNKKYDFRKKDYALGWFSVKVNNDPIDPMHEMNAPLASTQFVGIPAIKQRRIVQYDQTEIIENITFNHNGKNYLLQTDDRDDFLASDLKGIINSFELPDLQSN